MRESEGDIDPLTCVHSEDDLLILRGEGSTHKLLDGGGPPLVQHRATLCVVDFETQREADWTDVVSGVLSTVETWSLTTNIQSYG